MPQPQRQPPPGIPAEGISFMGPEEQDAFKADAEKASANGVRAQLLRAMEVCAQNATMPLSSKSPKEYSQAALQFAQAFLLIDPSVDAEGVPLEHHVELNAAAQKIAAENKPKTEELKGARADNPRPKPRV